ncbi:MAG: hypothetical protein WCD87_10975 [Pseudolabrys sp.]
MRIVVSLPGIVFFIAGLVPVIPTRGQGIALPSGMTRNHSPGRASPVSRKAFWPYKTAAGLGVMLLKSTVTYRSASAIG